MVKKKGSILLLDNNMNEKENKEETVPTQDLEILMKKKIDFFKEIIQKTLLYYQKNKIFDILGVNEIVISTEKLTELNDKLNNINILDKKNSELNISCLQYINNELSLLFKNYGTENLNDLLLICFGNNIINNKNIPKLDLLQKYFHPTGYKLINRKDLIKNNLKSKNNEELEINEKTENFDCFDAAINVKAFHLKVFGIKIFIHHEESNKTLLIYGIVDQVLISLLNNTYLLKLKKKLTENLPTNTEFDKISFNYFLDSLLLKDYLIHSNYQEIINKFIGYLSQLNILKQKTLSQTIKDFILDNIYYKRLTLIQLLIFSENIDNQYLAYLLYDLLSNDSNNNSIDTQEQIILYESFPWSIKRKFLHCSKTMIQYTNDLSNFDFNKVTLEQQICLMKINDNIKEKAIIKLKELKNKNEDGGSKARQYLEGLLKIPFGIYKKEPILIKIDEIKKKFIDLLKNNKDDNIDLVINKNSKNYNYLEILQYIHSIDKNKLGKENNKEKLLKIINKRMKKLDKNNLLLLVSKINIFLEKNKIKYGIINYSNKKKQEVLGEVNKLFFFIDKSNILEKEIVFFYQNIFIFLLTILDPPNPHIQSIKEDINYIEVFMNNLKKKLDDSIYGHDKAKKQIENIIGQWINGKQDGYCFGFEGPPGIGKTSLAKNGIANCLKDNNGISRPFSMIQLGGDSNGSTLHGHNYTYVGSNWGSIVQILMDKKCMNPIIFIDEVDKISKTEHGREIIGILTHLLDSTQNDCFQDKYFAGIDFDLSKALFILSYNDVTAIDKILLDRIHRIKFDALSLEDKVIIAKNHLLPNIYEKMGLENVIIIGEEEIKFIIEEYTSEAGVRKLKEILFEIIGNINLNILKEYFTTIGNEKLIFSIPIVVTIDDLKNKYLSEKEVINLPKIHSSSVNNIINGMYANSFGHGGILPFQACFIPTKHFLEIILTGNQQEIMKEGMILSKNLAWNLTEEKIQKQLIKKYNNYKNNCIYGININALGLSIPKDGPSASGAITVLIFALLNNKKIKNYFSMTGEVSLDGKITKIGGLENKIIGSLKSGVTSIIYPIENEKDFQTFFKKHEEQEIVKNASFYPVETIQKVFELIFE
jgi:ATP-dependent Lon protease